jgi:hypothetical protein
MANNSEHKLKRLLENHQPGTVCLASWLEDHADISRNLQTYYRKAGWLESVGSGAFKRPGDAITWKGALHTLQTQAKLPIHVGARTALALQGRSHYLQMGRQTVFLFSPPRTHLPRWFKAYDWQATIQYINTNVLPEGLGLVEERERDFAFKVSAPERAMLECLYLSPESLDLVECYQIMEGLNNLRPKLVQQLLEACSSIKAKRLFLFMAEKAAHQWFHYLDVGKVNLGSGVRSLVQDGAYVASYKITVPMELAE